MKYVVFALAVQVGSSKFVSLTLTTALVVVVIIVALGYVIWLMKRDLSISRPEHSRHTVEEARKKLLELAQRKRSDRSRVAEMQDKLEQQKEEQEEEARAREEVRASLAEHVESAFGMDCPHCQVEMLREDEIIICPTCLRAHHRVCFELEGCNSGCQLGYAYLYPADSIIELPRPRK